MNYFYDLLINLSDDVPYNFFEWNKNDDIMHLKKSPVFKINTSDLKNFLSFNIKIDEDFLTEIENKTEGYDKNFIKYMALFTDNNNSLVLEFNEEGKAIARSKLLLEEQLDLMEIAYSLKRVIINYKKLDLINQNDELRQIKELKHFLNLEIKTLYENNNLSKLRYLYNEVFNQDNKELESIYKDLKKEINRQFNENHLKLFDIIKLSYKHLSI